MQRRKTGNQIPGTMEKSKHQMVLNDDKNENEADIMGMFSSILSEIKSLKKQNEDFKIETKKDILELRNEIKGLDKRIDDKYSSLQTKVNNMDNSTNEKISNLEKELKWLQEAEERRQRKEKRRNIIIKSKDLRLGNDQEMHEKVREILRRTESNVEFTRATYIGKNKMEMDLARVELKSLEEKITVMKNKSKLRGENCYIDDDMTKQEREIQSALRQKAKEEREKGNIAKVGYQKLLINDKWLNWKDLPGLLKT